MSTGRAFGIGTILFCIGWAVATCNGQDLISGESSIPCATKESATRRVIPFAHIREADVLWARRIWSYIDLRQKINHPLFYPMEPTNGYWSLFDIICYGLSNEWITAYSLGPSRDNDEFQYQLSPQDVDSILRPRIARYRESMVDGSPEMVISVEPLRPSDVVGYMIKEDWLFDKQRSERVVRIIGIAPMVQVYSESGEIKGSRELFWLYYPECRYLLTPCEVYNGHSTATHVSFDQLLITRRFQANIIKEDNVYDRSIDAYTKGIEALLESERIKQTLFEMEHDLWSY
jgi:gliding motility associated protien GldN